VRVPERGQRRQLYVVVELQQRRAGLRLVPRESVLELVHRQQWQFRRQRVRQRIEQREHPHVQFDGHRVLQLRRSELLHVALGLFWQSGLRFFWQLPCELHDEHVQRQLYDAIRDGVFSLQRICVLPHGELQLAVPVTAEVSMSLAIARHTGVLFACGMPLVLALGCGSSSSSGGSSGGGTGTWTYPSDAGTTAGCGETSCTGSTITQTCTATTSSGSTDTDTITWDTGAGTGLVSWTLTQADGGVSESCAYTIMITRN
jgi:hypothetical protein